MNVSSGGAISAPAPPRPPGLWSATGKLLRLRVRIWANGFRRAGTKGRVLRIVGVLGLAVLMGLAFYVSRSVLAFLASPDFTAIGIDAASILDGLPVLVMGGAFLGILLTSFGVLLQSLYLAGDMDFLLSAPIPIRAVFLTKLLQAILPNFALMGLLGMPLLFGLGSIGAYNAAYYPLVVLAMAVLSLAGAGLASLLVMGIVRLFPARRVAEVLGFVGALVSILCSQSGQLANLGDVSANQMARAAQWLARFDTPWSPLAWAGRGVVEIGQGHWLPGLAMLGLTFALSVGVFVVALTAAERLYYSGWASLSVVRTRRRRMARAAAPRVRGGWRSSPVWAIVVKDFTVLRRDLRNLSQMVTPIILGIVYAVFLVRGGGEPPPGRGEAPGWFMEGFRQTLSYGDVAIAMFVGWILLSRLAAVAFSQEGRSYWIIKTAPVNPNRLIAAKFLSAFLPATALGWLFVLALSILRPASLAHIAFSLVVIGSCYAAATGLHLAFGIVGAVFDWEDPRQMQRSAAGCLSMLASTVGVGVCLVFFFGPVVGGAFLGLSPVLAQGIGLVLGVAVSAVCAVGPLMLVRRRVPRLGEA